MDELITSRSFATQPRCRRSWFRGRLSSRMAASGPALRAPSQRADLGWRTAQRQGGRNGQTIIRHGNERLKQDPSESQSKDLTA
jgi:hypothetical protein